MRDEVFSQRIQDMCAPILLPAEELGATVLVKRELRSEDRDKVAFPDPSDVVYDLGGTFTNIVSISIDPQGFEFPNTLDGITDNNNSAKWSFSSDPTTTYECFVPRGNYVLESILGVLAQQMNEVMQTLSRQFTYQYVRESRLIEFTSYLNTATPANPFLIENGVATVTITLPNHNFQVGNQFLLTTLASTDGLGGLSISDLSGIFKVKTVVDTNSFEFDLNGDVPYSGGQFGGPPGNVLVGKLDPFKFIHSSRSVLPQVGYVAENSATLCTTATVPYVFDITTNGFVVRSSQPHYCAVSDRLTLPTDNSFVTVLEIVDALTLRLDTLIPLNTTKLMNESLVTLFLPNLCENKGYFDTANGACVSGPRSDLIPPSNIYYVDNDHVVVRPVLHESVNKNTYRVSSPTLWGYSSTQASLINGIPLQYINLQGMTSVAITLPEIQTNYYTKNVQRIWTKIQLSDQATSDLFNTQSSTQGTFQWPQRLDKLHLRIVTMQNDLVDFQGMNYSFTVHIKLRQQPKSRHSHYLYYPRTY